MSYPAARYECLVVDNGSEDDTIPILRRRFPWAKILALPKNLGFAGGIGAGVKAAKGEYVVFLNNDMRVSSRWLEAYDDVLGSTGAVCATGKILDRTGTKIDFVGGILLFDGHALQPYQGADAALLGSRADGIRSTFIACGGNMAVKKAVFQTLGGFDDDFFAYTEDVDFSWRLHAAGHEVLFVPEAVTFHEHQGTSRRFGAYRRGFLYERNALWCLYKNIEDVYFHNMVHAAWVTLMHRTRWIVALHEPESMAVLASPFPVRGDTVQEQETPGRGGNDQGLGWKDRLRQEMAKGRRILAQDGFCKTLDRAWMALCQRWSQWAVTARTRHGEQPTRLVWNHPYVLSQLQALWAVNSGFETLAAKRHRVQALRKVSDRELFLKFPPWVVTTYPGDEALFGASWFREWLPKEIPFCYGSLEDVHGNTAVQRHHPHL